MPIQFIEKSTYMGYVQAFAKEVLTEKAYICQYLILCIRKKLNNHLFNKNDFGIVPIV